MNFMTRIVLWGLLLCFPAVGNAKVEDSKSTEVGVGIICDSARQVERYLALHNNGTSPLSAIELVNSESHDPTACALAAIAFIRGEEIKAIAVTGGIMRVTEITILAAQTEAGWQRMPALHQYTAIFEKLIET